MNQMTEECRRRTYDFLKEAGVTDENINVNYIDDDSETELHEGILPIEEKDFINNVIPSASSIMYIRDDILTFIFRCTGRLFLHRSRIARVQFSGTFCNNIPEFTIELVHQPI